MKAAFAQPVRQPDFFYLNELSEEVSQRNAMPASSLKPFIYQFNLNPDSFATAENKLYGKRENLNRAGRKLKYESLLEVDSPEFKICFDPLFLFEYGPDQISGKTLYRNTRGVRVTASIGREFYFETSFLENQARYPQYVMDMVDSLNVFPQQGRAKPFKTDGADFAMAWGTLHWKPVSWLMLRAGHDRFFIGNGYRSLLLSDNAFVMPFAQLTVHGKKWSYTSVWSNLQTLRFGAYVFNALSEPVFTRKGYTFQYLTWRPLKFIEAGFFLGTIWSDFPGLMALPLPGAGNMGNTSINQAGGLNLHLSVLQKYRLYGQVLLNGKERYGWQAGMRSSHIAGIRNLSFLAEYNQVMPYTYQSKSNRLNSPDGFHHYNQSLAHPLGANFREYLGILQYRYRDLFFWAKVNYYEQGRTGSQVLPLFPSGQNLTLSEPPPPQASFLEGSSHIRSIREIRAGYLLNRKTHLLASIALQQATGSNQSTWINLSIGTRLWNQYTDF
jgi:hypothetical protein